MQDERQYARLIAASLGPLMSAGDADGDWVDELQVARVVQHFNLDRSNAGHVLHRVTAKVVFDVAGFALDAVWKTVGELLEQGAIALPKHVDEDVHSAAVCHPNDDSASAGAAATGNGLVQHRH